VGCDSMPFMHLAPASSVLVSVSRLGLFALLGVVLLQAPGCGSKRDRLILKQAKEALESGNTTAALDQTKQVLRTNPRNIQAKLFLGKIKTALLKSAKESVDQKQYGQALEPLQKLLELEPDHEEALSLQAFAKKHKLLADARTAQEENQLADAIELVGRALKEDGSFEEARELQDTLLEVRDDQVKAWVQEAPMHLQNDEPEQVMDSMQQVLKLDPNHAQAAEYLREAQVAKLAKDKRVNLAQAKQFLEEGRFQAAIESANKILQVDATNFEAKAVVDRANAEMNRPEIEVTGISVIGGHPVAAIDLPALGESKLARVGQEVGPFRVTDINPGSKSVRLEYVPTGTVFSIDVLRE